LSLSASTTTGTRSSAAPSATGGGEGSSNPDSGISSATSVYGVSKVVVGNYVPIIVGRAFVGLLTPFYQSALMHDPIRQLTSSEGAPFSALAGSPGINAPIQFAMLVAYLGSGFTAGTTFLDTSYCTDIPCAPKLSANPWVMNVIICALVIQAIAILFLISQWWRKPSSLSADPTSIAGVAVVMGHPKIEADFSNIPADMTAAELKQRFKDDKYKLGTFMTSSGVVKFGIMPREPQEGDKKDGSGFFSKLGALKEKIPFLDSWANNKSYYDAVFLMLLLALLGLTCSALSRVDQPKIVFLATAAASGTGMRIFFCVLGVIVSAYWGVLFRGMSSYSQPVKQILT
jgi:hypothetical protein